MAENQSVPVTVGEYADFLNAVAVTDVHTLYHETMDEITRDGEPGDYHYEAVAGGENLPITFVTWFDEARYCNWKEHGSPMRDEVTSETTETGSYTLNDDMSGSVMKNSGAHYFLPTSEEDSFIDPTLASNDRGFSIIEIDGGDHFNAASFLGTSNPEAGDGTWSTFDEVIGVVGVIAVIGGGAGYAYHRCRAPHEQISIDRTVAGETAANRRAEEGVEAANRDRVEEEKKEQENPTDMMVDDVTGVATGTQRFVQDQRSGLKKWADWLRGHNHRNSIFKDADQIDYIQGEDLISPEDQSRCQKFIRWMTQRAYTYKDVDDFKKRNP
ncbi:MAG: SUMF1/EgtB/PvdO family nonheme iron enzyme [Verrucomicrobiota bacterium]